jgi:ankyrin repeat protein
MITNFKIFEKVQRTFNVGDNVIWWYSDSLIPKHANYRVAKKSLDVEYGELCEITQVKGEKGKLYVKAKNLRNNRQINNWLDASGTRVSSHNPEGHWFEAKLYFKKPEDFEWTIFRAIQYEKIDIIKELLSSPNFDIDEIKNNYGISPILAAGKIDNYEIAKLLIDAGADWNYFDSEDRGFLDYMLDNSERIIKEYPEKYEEYLKAREEHFEMKRIKKNAELYNL